MQILVLQKKTHMSACAFPGKNYRASTRHHWQHKHGPKADFPPQCQSQLSTIVSLCAPRLSLALLQWKSAVAVPAQRESHTFLCLRRKFKDREGRTGLGPKKKKKVSVKNRKTLLAKEEEWAQSLFFIFSSS